MSLQGQQLIRGEQGPDGAWPDSCATAVAPETHSFITQGTRILNIQLESNCLGSNPSLAISSLCD